MLRAVGAAMFLLGVTALAVRLGTRFGGWVLPEAGRLPMPLTALAFLLLGLTLWRLVAGGRAQALWLRGLGLAIAALAVTGLIIDTLAPGHPTAILHHATVPLWQEAAICPNGSVAFFSLGMIVLLIPSGSSRAAILTIQGLFVTVFSIAFFDIIGNAVSLHLAFPWYTEARMTTAAALGVLTAGGALLWHSVRSDWYRGFFLANESRKLTLMSAVILLLIALSAGIAGFSMMTITLDEMLQNNLRMSLDHRKRIFEVALERAIDNARLIATRPRFLVLMGHASQDRVDEAERAELERIFANILATTGVSAFEIYDNRGRHVGARGHLVMDSEIDAPVRAPGEVRLRWNQGTLLHVKFPMYDGNLRVGQLVADMPLKDLDRLTANLTGLGETGTMAVCAPLDAGMQCFPNRLNNHQVFKSPRRTATDGHPLPMGLALAGQDGVAKATDAHGQEVMAAYSPIGDFGLGMVVRMRTGELYLPIRNQLPYLLLVVMVPVLIGVYLLRWQLVPLVRKLVHEVEERRLAEDRLSFLAHHDYLTTLPNRVLFMDRLEQAMVEAGRYRRLVVVMFLDIDNFKMINDSFGHETGDELLRQVGTRLTECVRRGDTVARLSGDEFALVLGDMAHGEDASQIADKIMEQFSRPIRVSDRDHFITLSLGISLYPSDGDNPEMILKNADIAMYRAKAQGKNRYQFYSTEMAASAAERLALLTELRFAIERGEFSVHYQPQVDLRGGQINGLEALLRWRHPARGLIPPSLFIPLAEEAGLIHVIGEWVLRETCRQVQSWKQRGFGALRVAVNFSAYQFRNRHLVDSVLRVLAETELDPRQLVVEITESALLQDDDASLEILRAIVAKGPAVSLDDFGTGYSSLSYLKRFPIQVLKIDQSFVRDIASNPEDAAIAFAIVSLAHSLGRRVVAEGVETEEQLALLRGYGCDCMQGHLFSPPLPAAEFEALLREGRRLAVETWGAVR